MRKKAFALLVILAILAACFPAPADAARFSRTEFSVFDTVITLIGYADSQAEFDRAADGLMAKLREYNKIFDAYNAYPGLNNLWYVNRYAGRAPVSIPDPLYDLLAWCKEQWAGGEKRVNVAMGAVLSIWHDYRQAGLENSAAAKVPPMDALTEAAGHINLDDVILNEENRTVYFADPAIRLDIGAVAKGYAADQAQAYLSAEMPSFLLSLGGNIYAGEAPLDGRAHWGVSVQDPDGQVMAAAGTDILDVLFIDKLSAVTSGDYQRFYTVDGVRYHHIIDPETLMPSAYCRSVTVICESSLLADYLTTRLFLTAYEEGRAYIDSLPGVEALWVLPDGTIEMTEGMRSMSRANGATAYAP